MSNERIGLMIGASSGHTRRILAGIRRFVEETGERWIFAITPHEQPDVETLAAWQPRGVIAHFWTRAGARKLAALRIPVINVGTQIVSVPVAHVGNDNAAIGRCGALHLIERRFQRFAYVGWTGIRYALQRKAAFLDALAEVGGHAEVYEDEPGSWVRRLTNSVSNHRRLCDWLRRLHVPTAVMACNDVRASHVLRACEEIGRAVPEEIAVLGVDNDETWCSLAWPPLSSVALDSEHIGFLAAQMLAQALAGNATPAVDLPPLNVVVRQSTDSLAIGMPVLAESIRYIREHMDVDFDIADVARAVGVKRRTLERLFRNNLGCSVAHEIRMTRLRHAQDLIVSTELPLADVAQLSGFSGYKHLWAVFRTSLGMTPVEYRQRRRPGNELPPQAPG